MIRNRRRVSFWVVLIISLFLVLTGCSKNSKDTKKAVAIPEKGSSQNTSLSYDSAIKFIEQGDYNSALKYLNITISENKSSNYAAKAYILKSILLRSRLKADNVILDSISKGVELASGQYTEDENKQISKINENINADINATYPQFYEAVKYTYENYNRIQSTGIFKLSVKALQPSSYLDDFASTGYPIPKEIDINEARKDSQGLMFQEYIRLIIKGDRVSFGDYFYYMGLGITEKDRVFAKNLFGRSIQLNQFDKNSEIRLKAQEYMEKLK